MTELNQQLYQVSLNVLTEAGVPEPLADAASRIVATDDPNQPNLGRSDADIQVCQTVAYIYNAVQRLAD
ncbi:hypothetical protein NIES4071_65330 [Calothrix sp. NIES-4071]|nr:hypothetical protein NIES4071_65330 [Calothrix sp. NIES-4071]BAZ60837.1 hypothetical protein NIES4105_65290 [Calothrix sp. NIES-4105]